MMVNKQPGDELVWIEGDGSLHPVGPVAQARMRLRAGGYRLLPTPPHLLFMRLTGADGRRDAEDGRVVRIAGEITAIGGMLDIIALLGQSGARGELVVMDGQLTRSVFFEQGNVVGVATDADDERIGSLLYKYGAISPEQIDPVLARARSGDPFGMAAVDLGFTTQEQVYKALGRQVEAVVFSVLTATDGAYCFLEDFDETRLLSRQVVQATNLLLQHVTRIDEIRHFRPWIPNADYIPLRLKPRSAGDEKDPVWVAIDGMTSVGEIGRLTELGEFEVTRQIFALTQVHKVTILAPRVRGGLTALIELANMALQTIHQAADAGGRGTALRHNVAAFAQGAYDALFAAAGPYEAGIFDVAIVVRNTGASDRPTQDQENLLREMLYDYVAFALFSANASLGPSSTLATEVEPLLAKLRPVGQSGLHNVGRKTAASSSREAPL